jgi:pimeloyl-ACP methyl ester carboxylesterase
VPPRIRFFRGTSGKRIAYAVDGQGPLLIFPAWWVSHLERDFDDPGFRGLFTKLATRMTVVRYDRPGVGLSDREPHPYSLDDELNNLEAIIDELGADRVALMGGSCGGPPAIAYAARHPERTSHLVLYGAYACGPRLAADDLKQAMMGLVRANWGLGSRALTDLLAPQHSTEERQRLAETQRDSASPETAAALLDLIYRMDVSDRVARVRVPTLVLHRKGDRAISFDHGRELAAQIVGATFMPLAGDAHLPWIGDWESIARATLDFLAPGPRPLDLGTDENVFVREGEVWTVAFAGQSCHLKDARGLVDLAVLLSRPSEEISTVQLLEGPDAAPSPAATPDPVLDERARLELRNRLRRLEEIIERAEAADDAAAARGAADERDALLRELRVTTGLGGRRRALVDPVERARKAVSGRIRGSIEKIRAALPDLARHLDQSITTGSFCRYAPPHPTRWRT